MILRITTINISGKRVETNKVFNFNKKVTFLQAIKEVSSKREELLAKLKNDKHREPKVKIPMLSQAWERYIAMKQNQLSSNTLASYNLFTHKWILSDTKLAKTPITHITTEMLQNIVNKMLNLGMSPRTSKSVKETLRPMFNLYLLEGILKTNPAILIQIPKFDNQVNIELDNNKIKELYNALYNYPIEPFRSIFIWLSHGRRLNEVLSLEWRDINFTTGTYNIRYENNKARKPMIYKLSKELIKTLENMDKQKNGYVFHAIKSPKNKMNKSTIRAHWCKILAKLEIKIRIHDLRHLIGGVLVSEGKTLEQIASVLGHTSISVTKRYSKVRREVAAESLDEFFKRVKDS